MVFQFLLINKAWKNQFIQNNGLHIGMCTDVIELDRSWHVKFELFELSELFELFELS